MTDAVVAELSREMRRNADPVYRVSVQRFFREPVKLYGVRTPVWRRITADYWKRVKDLPKADVFRLCEELLAIRNGEERGVAFDWAFRMRNRAGHENTKDTKRTSKGHEEMRLTAADFPRLERWLKTHVSNWGSCDSLCCGVLGAFFVDHPEFLPRAKKWAKSKNRWLRRAAAVCHIIPNRKGMAYDEAFEVADILLEDTDDMVQKGYGWMLKEIANREQQRVFDYVMENRHRMPRTALRYAIEKMPAPLKKRAMARP